MDGNPFLKGFPGRYRMMRYLFYCFLAAAAFTVGAPDFARAQDGDLRFVITSAVASDPSYTNYRALTNYVASRTGKQAVFISGLTYGQVDDLFMSRRVDVGFLCNSHYARRKTAVKLEPIAAPVITDYGEPKFQIYIIVPMDSPIKSFDDLKGKSIDLADPLSSTTLYAASMLRKKNETIQSFFGKTIYSGSHDMTIELVANKMVDAGFIDGHIWDYHTNADPVFSAKTRILHRSRDFTIPPVVVRKSTPEDLKRKLRQVLLTMHEYAEGREILKKLRIEKFVDIKERDYDDVLRLYNSVKDLI
jgi:phosphonate transport system substrate-binding protein